MSALDCVDVGASLDGASAALSTLESTWLAVLREDPKRVVFTDGTDRRVVVAAARLAAEGAVQPILLAERREVARVAEEACVDLPDSVHVLAPEDAFEVRSIREGLRDAARGRRIAADVLIERQRDPLYLGASAVHAGYVDACVGGSTRPTAAVLRAALSVIGLNKDAHCVSSSFLMALQDGRIMTFGDCAVLPQPDAEQLAEVALATSSTFMALTGDTPRIAFLSFSTKGSASHPHVSLVREGATIAARRAPTLCLDGELQADAALDVDVAAGKAPGSPIAGKANVLIFPSLDAGNIGYKLIERLGHARAVGPLLQGLAAPMNDLSRGCSSEDIRAVALISAVMARGT